METVCHNQLIFESLFSKEVVADFAGGRITSDAGGLLLRELDQRYRLAENAARCLHDPRDSHKVKHDLLTLVRQRLFAIAQGYEDANDAATLAQDPAFKIMAGKAPESAGDLASQPTLSRFENRVTAKDLRRLSDRLLELGVFTLSSTRLEYYSLPALPPLALILGWRLDEYLRAPSPGRSVPAALLLLGLWWLGTLLWLGWLDRLLSGNRREFWGMFPLITPLAPLAIFPLPAVGAAGAWAGWRRPRWARPTAPWRCS
jgi:hypothetical protein